MLHQAYEKPNQSVSGPDDIEKIVLSSVASYDKAFILLDALDWCSKGSDVRQNVLECLERLLQQASNLQLLVTSREVRNVCKSIKMLGAEPKFIATQSVHADICKYTALNILDNQKLY